MSLQTSFKILAFDMLEHSLWLHVGSILLPFLSPCVQLVRYVWSHILGCLFRCHKFQGKTCENVKAGLGDPEEKTSQLGTGDVICIANIPLVPRGTVVDSPASSLGHTQVLVRSPSTSSSEDDRPPSHESDQRCIISYPTPMTLSPLGLILAPGLCTGLAQ